VIGITSESVIDIASEWVIDIASESVIDMPRNTQSYAARTITWSFGHVQTAKRPVHSRTFTWTSTT